MAWNTSRISEVRIDPVPSQGTLFVSWSSSAPDGTWYQVYSNYRLAWYGRQLHCELPIPSGAVDIAVGTIDASEFQTDLSGSVAGAPGSGNAVELAWLGGVYLDADKLDDVAGFRVYGESTPGGGVNLNNPLVDLDVGRLAGAGRGPAGRGGAGRAATRYTWTSGLLSPGTWAFDVRAYDAAGNESTVDTVSATIDGPPGPPAPFSDGLRLHYSYDPGTRIVTLSWNAPA